MQGGFGRVRDLRHLPIVTQPSGAVRVATACRGRDETGREENGYIAMRSPFIIALTTLGRVRSARAAARSRSRAHRDVIRARIVGSLRPRAPPTPRSPPRWVCMSTTVRKWRRRFVAAGLPGLEDLPRSGRRRVFTHGAGGRGQGAGLHPARRDRSVSRCRGCRAADLAAEAITPGRAETISAATVRRWLASDVIKALAAPVLDLPA